MTKVYVKQLGTTVEVPDGYTPEQAAQYVRDSMPTPQPDPALDTGPDFAAEQQNLQQAQLEDAQAVEQIRQEKDIANQNPWVSALKSAAYGAESARAGTVRAVGEGLRALQEKTTFVAPGNVPEYEWMRGEGAQQMQRDATRQSMAYKDPEVDFEKGVWQGQEGEGFMTGLERTARGATAELGPTAFMAAASAPFAAVAPAAGWLKAVSYLPKFFQLGARAAPLAASMRAFEGLVEGGEVAQDATLRGRDDDEVSNAAMRAVVGNIPLAAVDIAQATAFLGLLPRPAQKALGNVSRDFIGKIPMKVFKKLAGLSAAITAEGAEEAVQEEIQNWAVGEGFDPKVVWNPIYAREKHPAAFNIGMLTSGGQGAAHIAMDTALKLRLDQVDPEQRAEIIKGGHVRPEDQEAVRAALLEAAEARTARELNPENPKEAELELTLDGLDPIDPKTIPGIMDQFVDVDPVTLKREAMVALEEIGPEADVVQAYRASRPETKAQFRSLREALAANDKDVLQHQDRQEQTRREVEELAEAQPFVEDTMARQERQAVAGQPQQQRRGDLLEGMETPPAGEPPTTQSRIDEAETAADVMNVMSEMERAKELDGRTLAYGRAKIERLGGFQKPGTTGVEIGAEGNTQKSAEVSTAPVQSQEQLQLQAGEQSTAALPSGQEEVVTDEESPFHMDRLRKAVLAINPNVEDIKPTRAGARVIINGQVNEIVATDIIDPNANKSAAEKHQLQPGEVGGMPATVEFRPDGTFKITLARGFDYSTGANVQSLTHEIFHVAKMMGVLSDAEVAKVYQPYVNKVLKGMGVKAKVNAKQLLTLDPTSELDGFSVKSILDKVEEEAADAYGNWAPKNKGILNKIWAWLRKLASTDIMKLGEVGEAEQVYGRLRSGEAAKASPPSSKAPETAPTAPEQETGTRAAPEAEEATAPVSDSNTAKSVDKLSDKVDDLQTKIDNMDIGREAPKPQPKKQKGPGKHPNPKKIEMARRKKVAAARRDLLKSTKMLAQVREKHPGVKAAVWTTFDGDEKVYTGAAHWEAFMEADAEGRVDGVHGTDWMDGFLFPDGTFRDREETQKFIGISSSEELKAVRAGLKPEDAYKNNEELGMEPTDEELDDLMSMAQVRDVEQYRSPAGDIFNPLVMEDIQEEYPEELKTAKRLVNEVIRVKEIASGAKMDSLQKQLEMNDVLLEYWPDKFKKYEEELDGLADYAADNNEWDEIEQELLEKEAAERGTGQVIDVTPQKKTPQKKLTAGSPVELAQLRVTREEFNKAEAKAEAKADEFDWDGNEVARAQLVRAWTFGYLGMSEADQPKTKKQEAERIQIIDDVRQGVRDQHKAQVRQQRTAAWLRWFRDAAPEMKDANGNPILLFHGGFFDIEEIDLSKVGLGNYFGRAFYATTSPEDASENYANKEGGDRVAHLGRMLDDITYYVQENIIEDAPVLDIFRDLAETYGLTITDKDKGLAKMLEREAKTGNYGMSTAAEGATAWAAEKIVYNNDNTGRIYMLNMAAQNPLILASHTAPEGQTTWTVDINEETGELEGEASAYFDAISSVVATYTNDVSIHDAVIDEVMAYLLDGGVDFYGGELTAREAYDAIHESETMMWEVAEVVGEEDGSLPIGEVIRLVFDEMGYDSVIMDTGIFGGMAKSGTQHFITWKEDNVKTWSAEEPQRGSKNIAAQVRNPATIPGKPLFDYWFKNSKVTFNNGDPRPVYHGTVIRPIDDPDPKNKRYEYEAFEAFDPKKMTLGALGEGFYFASADYVTDGYAGAEWFDDNAFKQGGAVFQVYLSIKNPYYYDKTVKTGTAEHKRIVAALDQYIREGKITGKDIELVNENIRNSDFNGYDLNEAAAFVLREVLQLAEYDGIHAISDTDFGGPIMGGAKERAESKVSQYTTEMKPHGDVWVAFYPQQVKSVWNQGTWSPVAMEMRAQVRAQAMAGPPGMSQHEFDMAKTGMNDPRLNDWFGNKELKIHEAAVLGRQLSQELAKLAGVKSLFGLGGYKYGQEARDLAQSIHIYIDVQNEPDAYTRFYDKLSPYQKELADMAMNKVASSPELVAFANKIAKYYKEAGDTAMAAGVIHNMRENFVNRTWRLNGKAASEANRTFGTTTRHRRKRKLPTILQGWADGLELTTADAIENLVTYKEEIAKTIEDRDLIRQGRTTRLDPNDPESPFLFTHSRPRGHSYKELKHPNFKYYVYDSIERKGEITEEPDGPGYKFKGRKLSFRQFAVYKPNGKVARRVFKSWDEAVNWIDINGDSSLEIHERWENLREETIYAPVELADNLNKITEEGFTNKTFKSALKYNALIKSWILLTSLFHHMAFARSYWLGTNGRPFQITETGQIERGSKARIFHAYQEGLRMMDAHTPDIKLLMGNGLTLGRLQDWDIPVGEDKNRFSKWMDNKGKTSRKIKNFLGELRQRQTSFLFKNFGAGLKVQAALIELHHNREKFGDRMTDEQIAQLTARLINEDFGGLNFDRMGVSKKTQQILRFLLLAPDWTGSNFLTLKRLAQNVMGKDPESKVVREIYMRFWAGVVAKGVMATVAANLVMATLGNVTGDDEDDPFEKLAKAWTDDWTRLQWTGVDITPLYRLLAENDDGRRRYFSLIGHFKDPMRWALDPSRSVIHKGSPVSRLLLEAIEGKDWKGDGFTTVNELLGRDEKGYYKTSGPGYRIGDPKGGKLKGKMVSPAKRPGPLSFESVPSYLLTQMKGSTPVQVQELFAVVEGQRTWFDGIGRSLGFHMAPGRNTDYDLYNKKIEEFNDELQDLRLTDRKAYAQKRRENTDLIRAAAQLKGANTRIRSWKKKIAVVENNSKLTAEQKKELKENYENKIREIEAQYIAKFGEAINDST